MNHAHWRSRFFLRIRKKMTILLEGHTKTISVILFWNHFSWFFWKFWYWPSGLGGDVIWRSCWRTTDIQRYCVLMWAKKQRNQMESISSRLKIKTWNRLINDIDKNSYVFVMWMTDTSNICPTYVISNIVILIAC